MKIKFLLEGSNSQLVSENPDVDEAFKALAYAQRDKPEGAMLKAQVYASGVLSPLIEHVGDLTHRIAQHGLSDMGSMGHESLLEKVPFAIRRLTDKYGFEKEVYENIRSNASYNKIPVEQFEKELRKRMKAYEEAHYSLPVYNRLQFLCKMAAVYAGRWDFKYCLLSLQAINEKLSLPIDEWIKQASLFKRDNAGKLLQYTDWQKNES